MISEYILIVFLAVYAGLFYAIERRLAKSQKVITGLISDFTGKVGGARKQAECLDKKN